MSTGLLYAQDDIIADEGTSSQHILIKFVTKNDDQHFESNLKHF